MSPGKFDLLSRTFAVVRDARRRGGVRVVRCAVLQVWEPLSAASLEELRTRAPWILPLALALLFTASAEKSAAEIPLAGAGAESFAS